MTRTTAAELVRTIERRAEGNNRILVAVVGPPGSGKSTLAADIVARIGPSASVLPMDGFHLDNDRLRQMQLFHRKGAPETFDAEGFVNLMRRILAGGDVSYPTFDREADQTVPDAGRIGSDTRIVVVEGNYLLLNTPPWSALAALFDLTVRLDVPRDVLKARLIARWRDHGLAPADAEARAVGNDMVNADFVLANSSAPDFIMTTEAGQT